MAGELYSVLPLGAQEGYDDIASRLESLGITLPPGRSRYPTVREIRDVLDHLEGHTAAYNVGRPNTLYILVQDAEHYQGAWSYIAVKEYHGNDDVPLRLSFERGWDTLNLLIAERLSRISGPLVIVPSSGAAPIVVTPELDLDRAILVWRG